MTEAINQREREFVEDPGRWPRWPILPIKRRDRDYHNSQFCGLVYASDLTRVYFVNMFGLAGREPKPATWGEALAPCEFRDYPSVEALLADYEVD